MASNQTSATYGKRSIRQKEGGVEGLGGSCSGREDDWFKAMKLFTLAHRNSLCVSRTREALQLGVRTTGQATIGSLNSFQNPTKNSFKYLEQCSKRLLNETLLSRE